MLIREAPILFWGVVLILAAVAFALAGQVLVARVVPMHIRVADNTALGTIYAALYVLYALSLAFTLFFVGGAYREAESTTSAEADTVADLYQLAKQFPEPERHQMQDLSRSYARVVAEEEWPLLGQGNASRGSPHAQALADELVETVQDFEPTTSTQQTRYGQALTLVQSLDDDRKLRLLSSHQGIPAMMWIVLLVGGVLTISFTFFFGLEGSWLHRASITALTVLVVLILYTVYRVEYPFTGDIQVTPAEFEAALHSMKGE
jgi:hypothetical protein